MHFICAFSQQGTDNASQFVKINVPLKGKAINGNELFSFESFHSLLIFQVGRARVWLIAGMQ